MYGDVLRDGQLKGFISRETLPKHDGCLIKCKLSYSELTTVGKNILRHPAAECGYQKIKGQTWASAVLPSTNKSALRFPLRSIMHGMIKWFPRLSCFPVFPAEQLRKFLARVPTQPLSGWVSRWIENSLDIRASQPASTGLWDPQTSQ